MSPTTPDHEHYISADELAPLLGMSVDWVYLRAKSGDLPSYVLPGGRRRFRYLGGLRDDAALAFGAASVSTPRDGLMAPIRRSWTSRGERRLEVRWRDGAERDR